MGTQKLKDQQIKVIQDIYSKYNKIIFQNGNLSIVISNLKQELEKSQEMVKQNINNFRQISNQQKKFIQLLKNRYGQSIKLNTQDWTIQD